MDWRGEVFSLSRLLKQKSNDLKERLGEPQALPSVDEVKAAIDRSLAEQANACWNPSAPSTTSFFHRSMRSANASNSTTRVNGMNWCESRKNSASEKHRSAKPALETASRNLGSAYGGAQAYS